MDELTKEPAEPGSIDEIFEIADLLQISCNENTKEQLSLPDALKLAVDIRRNDLLQEQSEAISEITESFTAVCAQVLAEIAKFSQKKGMPPVPAVGKRR